MPIAHLLYRSMQMSAAGDIDHIQFGDVPVELRRRLVRDAVVAINAQCQPRAELATKAAQDAVDALLQDLEFHYPYACLTSIGSRNVVEERGKAAKVVCGHLRRLDVATVALNAYRAALGG